MDYEDLALHNRILDLAESNESELVPFVWSNDISQSFKTFEDCIRHWYAYDSQEGEQQLNAKEEFGLSHRQVEKMTGKDAKKLGFSEIMFALHTDLYQEMEDTFGCSGMCRPGLFFFDKPLHMGAPEETCLHTFKAVLDKSARPFATSTLLAGITGLFLFLCHFGLYFRPKPEDLEL